MWSLPLGISVSDGRNRVVNGIHCIICGCTVLDASNMTYSLIKQKVINFLGKETKFRYLCVSVYAI